MPCFVKEKKKLFNNVCYEIRAAIKKMKLGKETGPGSILVERLEALEDYRTDKITTLLNEIYDTRQIPPDIAKSIVIALPKELKQGR